MPEPLPRTPIHVFGEAFAEAEPPRWAAATLHHAADFDACAIWPDCGCLRACATAGPTPKGSAAIFWLALALSTLTPIVFGAALLSIHFYPEFWSTR